MALEEHCPGPMQASHRREGTLLECSPLRSLAGPWRRRRERQRLPFTVALVALHALGALPGAASRSCYITPYEPCEVSRGYTGNCLEVIKKP